MINLITLGALVYGLQTADSISDIVQMYWVAMLLAWSNSKN